MRWHCVRSCVHIKKQCRSTEWNNLLKFFWECGFQSDQELHRGGQESLTWRYCGKPATGRLFMRWVNFLSLKLRMNRSKVSLAVGVCNRFSSNFHSQSFFPPPSALMCRIISTGQDESACKTLYSKVLRHKLGHWKEGTNRVLPSIVECLVRHR